MAKAKAKSVEKTTPKYEKRVYKNWVPPVTALKNQLAQRDEDIAIMKLQLNDANHTIEDLRAKLRSAETTNACHLEQLDCVNAAKEALKELLVKLYTL